MRILLYCSEEFPVVGGQSAHMETLGQALVELGHEVEFLSISNLPPIARALLNKSTALVRRLTGPWLWVIYHLYFMELLLGVLVWMANRKSRHDIIQTQDPTAYASTFLIRRLTRTPVLLTVHGYFAYEYVAGRAKKGSFIWDFLQHQEVSASKSARIVFTVDQGIMQYLVDLGDDRGNVIVMRNFVDVNEFSPEIPKEDARREFGLPSDKFIILCPRRLAEKCGVIYAAYAAGNLRDSWGTDFLLVYAGEGPERDNIVGFAEKSGLSQNIILLGKVPHARISRLFHCADAVVIPSITVGVEKEATSISALEAMASGVPVVASDVGGLKELIDDGVTGFLVPEKDSKALAEALKRIAAADQDKIVREARNLVVREYSHLSKAKEFLIHYERIVERQ